VKKVNNIKEREWKTEEIAQEWGESIICPILRMQTS
jgi:hypothetical protein